MELSRSCPLTEQSSHVTFLIHSTITASINNHTALFYRLWKISEVGILEEKKKKKAKIVLDDCNTDVQVHFQCVIYFPHRSKQ